MSAREEALALLRERFTEPWRVSVADYINTPVKAATASACMGAVTVAASSSDSPLAAARACIAAWDEATKDEVERGAMLGRGAAALDHMALDSMSKHIAAERALSDRLAEALRDYYNGLPSHGAAEALAAHAERRKA